MLFIYFNNLQGKLSLFDSKRADQRHLISAGKARCILLQHPSVPPTLHPIPSHIYHVRRTGTLYPIVSALPLTSFRMPQIS